MRTIKNKSKEMLAIENKFQMPLEELLRHFYVDKGMTYREMAKAIGTSRSSGLRWLERAGIYSQKLDI